MSIFMIKTYIVLKMKRELNVDIEDTRMMKINVFTIMNVKNKNIFNEG